MTDSVRNLIMGHVWIFQPYNNPNTNLKNNTKMGHWAQNQASAMAIPVLWPEPYRKWVRWTEEKKHHHGAGNLKDLERFWMKEWSLISCQVFSNLIRHYRRKFRAVKLANGGFKKYSSQVKLSFIVIPLHVGTYSGTKCRASQDHGAT